MTKQARTRWALGCVMALAVVAGGCGDDNGGKVSPDAAVDGFGGGSGGNLGSGGSGGQGASGDGGMDAAGMVGDGGLDDGGGDAAVALVSVTITPASPSLAKGTKAQLTATAIYSDNSTRNITADVVWTSTSQAVATVAAGLVTAVTEGTTEVSASLAGKSGSTTVTVTQAVLESITLEPLAPSVPVGREQAFTATGLFSDGSAQNLTTQVTWASSTEASATISAAGLAKTLAVGSTTISASFAGKMASTTLTVSAAVLNSIAVTPAVASLAAGTSQDYVATGVFSDKSSKDITTEVVWTSSDTSKATISNTDGSRGTLATRAPGAVTVTAALSGVMGTATLTVTNATLQTLVIDPVNPRAVRGTDVQFMATGSFSDGSSQDLTAEVTWVAAMPTIATISNAEGSEGLATTLAVGSTQISATLLGVSASVALNVTGAALTSIAVEPGTATVARYSQISMRAIGNFADGTTQDLTGQVAWTSVDPAIVTVSNASHSRGLATAQGPGTTMVTATYEGVTGSATVTVTDATVTSLVVTPAAPSLVNGTTAHFTATATFSDASTQDVTSQVTWNSSNNAVLVISNAANRRGLATARAEGSADVTATLAGITGSTTVSVVQATLMSITVTPANQTMTTGSVVAYKATGTYSGNVTSDLTSQVSWASGARSIATVSNAPKTRGRVTATGVGSTMIRASLGAVNGSTSVTVTAP